MKKLILEYEENEKNLIATHEHEKKLFFRNEGKGNQNKYASTNDLEPSYQQTKGCRVNGCTGLGNINKNYQTNHKEKYCPLRNQSQVCEKIVFSTENKISESDQAIENIRTEHLLKIREKNE